MNKLSPSMLFRTAQFIFLSAIFCTHLWAANGRITGRVYDAETDEPLVGVNIIVIEQVINGEPVRMDPPLGSATNIDGYYSILNVPPGLYNIRANMIGYATVIQTEVRVNTDLTAQVNFQLSPEAIAGEEVIIEADRKVVKPDVYGTVENISKERITDAPVERIDEFIDKVKGIEMVDSDEGHGLSIRGGDIRETDVQVDNISMRDVRSGNSYLNFNTVAVEEIQVKTSGFEAKYGGIQSGLVNVITKEGSRNRFTFDLEVTTVPAGQRRFFGTNPWSENSPMYKTFVGKYAMDGVPDSVLGLEIPDMVPFNNFTGWDNRRAQPTELDTTHRAELWRQLHPTYTIASRPDYFVQGAITGPLKGEFIPFYGDYAEKTSFLLGWKYESTQFAYPLGPRDDYQDWNAQLKLTTRFSPRTKMVINTMYAKISTINEGTSTDYGGALIDNSARFNYMSNTESSVVRQAALIGGSNFYRIYNRSRFQFFDKQFIIGGVKLSHSFNDRTYMTFDFNYSYSDNQLKPSVLDTTRDSNWISMMLPDSTVVERYMPKYYEGAPGGQATPIISNQDNFFELIGGVPAIDSSYSQVFQFKGEVVSQLNEFHQVESGFDLRYHDMFVYSGYGWSASSYPPSLFQYYHENPIELGLYMQDRLSYEGFIATLGIRADYFNPRRNGYDTSFPLSEGYLELQDYYDNLPGDLDSFERWKEYRKAIDDPPGWPEKEVNGQWVIAPRLGTSFPISTSSKLYFNYGDFYQRAPISFIYNSSIYGQLPTPELKMERTTAFEFGYEQSLLNNYLANVTFYYKDVQNRPLPKTYISYYEDIQVSTYSSEGYRDIRGIEVRLEKNYGRFFTFWTNYDYQVFSSGNSGLPTIYENQLKARLVEQRSYSATAQARPKINASLAFHTPNNYGLKFLGVNPFGGWLANFLIDWQDGGYIIWNPSEPNPDKQLRVDVVDDFNIDLRISKKLFDGKAELLISVKNLLNHKKLYTPAMLPEQSDAYKNSLHLPFKGDSLKGNDKWGEYNNMYNDLEKTLGSLAGMKFKNKDHIETGWYEAPIFLNPRRIVVGIRFNL